jgi:hypothetical protein
MAIDSSIPLALNTDDGILTMATLTELVEAVAEAEGMDSATVALIARYAREAGFIQKKGRGPSAAHMGVADAANLLIAVNASGLAQDARVVIPLYRDLIVAEYLWVEKRRIPNDGFFGNALELIIQSAIDGELPNTLVSREVPTVVRDAFHQGTIEMSIGFSRPEPRGEIAITVSSPLESPGGFGMSGTGLPLYFGSKDGRQKRALLKLKSGDRTDETRIGSRTIFSVAETLGSNRQYERKMD